MGKRVPAAGEKWLVSDLLGSSILDAHGHVLGHVADIQINWHPPYEIQGLLYGERGWRHRLHLPSSFPGRKKNGSATDFVPWNMVARLETGKVFLKQ